MRHSFVAAIAVGLCFMSLVTSSLTAQSGTEPGPLITAPSDIGAMDAPAPVVDVPPSILKSMPAVTSDNRDNCDGCGEICSMPGQSCRLSRIRCRTDAGCGGCGHCLKCKPYPGPHQADLFYNFYVPQTPCGGMPAGMYPCPGPVPPVVGQTYFTYQPLMPHEMLYPHCRRYLRIYDHGLGVNCTKVNWEYDPLHRAAARLKECILVPR